MAKKKRIRRHWPSDAPEIHRARRRTMYGLLSMAYTNMRSRATGRQHKEHIFKGLSYPTRDQFISWAINDRVFLICYRLWAESGYNKRWTPTVTRIDKRKGYDLDNMSFLSHSANSILTNTARWRTWELGVIRRLLNVEAPKT